MNQPVLIGIAGASGSGKSWLATKLRSSFLKSGYISEIIQEDSYYRDQSHLAFAQREKTNYDHPAAFEHELLHRHLRRFENGATIEVPQYDYAIHNRKSETKRILPCEVLIVEGILLFFDSLLRETLDFKIFLDVPIAICLQRRMDRDTSERGRSMESVQQQFEETVLPMYEQFIVPSKHHADLILDESYDLDEFYDQVLRGTGLAGK